MQHSLLLPSCVFGYYTLSINMCTSEWKMRLLFAQQHHNLSPDCTTIPPPVTCHARATQVSLSTGKAWDNSDNGHSAFFHSVYNFAVQVLSRMGFSSQETFKAVGKHNLHGIQEKQEVQTSLSQLYTEFKMFIIFSFSDSDTSTKSMRYPRGWRN